MDYLTTGGLSLPTLRDPPETLAPRAVVASALALTGLLTITVPVFALVAGVPTLAAVALAGAVYGTLILATGTFIEGAFAAVFVLATFNANIPLPILGVSRGGNAGVLHPAFMLVDAVALPLAGLFAYWWWTDHTPSRPLFDSRPARVAAIALTGLVVWSFLSAAVGNGPSRAAAAFWALFQARYLLVFVVAAVIARRIGIRPTVYSLLVAVGGQVLVALAQALHGGGFGLTQLGDYMGGAVVPVALGPLTINAGMFAGGFAGTVRVLAAVVILCTPLLVVLLMDNNVRQRVLAALALVGFVLVLRLARTDAGLGAFVVAIGALAAGLLALALRTRPWEAASAAHSRTDYALGGVTLLGTLVLAVVLYQTRSGNATTQTANGGAASATAEAVSSVPLISGSYLTTRFEQWTAALDVAANHPLFGIGGLNFTLVSDGYGLAHALPIHSAYFGYLAATGVVGLLLLLTTLTAVLGVALRNAFFDAPLADRPLWVALACGGVGFAAFVFWTALHNGSVAYLVLFALAGAVVGAAPADRTST